MTVEQLIPHRKRVSCEFDFDDADVILVSRDPPTEFHVHRVILAAASPFFYDMFTLPQAPTTNPEDLKNNNKPIIPVTESRDVLASLLHFIYPIPDPQLASLSEIALILDAAIKYDFTSVISTLRHLLVSPHYLQNSSTQVYAIASRFDLEEEAQIASSHTLRINLLDGPLCDDLKYISAWQYHRLLNLHRTRAKQALEIIGDDNCPKEIKCIQCNSNIITAHGHPKWWYEWEKQAKEELSVRPVSDTIFEIDFLAKAVKKAGCARCSGSVLDCWKWLMEMKDKVDALPATV